MRKRQKKMKIKKFGEANSNATAVTSLISVMWSFLSLVAGLCFIVAHYSEGLSNNYGYTLSKPLQWICFATAYAVAVWLIFACCRFICNAFLTNGRERKIVLYMLPLLIVLLVYLLKDISIAGGIQNYYGGDEKNIWDAAVRLYPFFFVYSSQLFLICFLLFPFILAPSIVKIIFVAYVFGYTIYRTKTYYKTIFAYLLYAVFVLKPFLEQGIRVHRMHWYAMLYLLVAVKLYYDYKQQRLHPDLDIRKLLLVSIILSILTIWRREGIYLAVWGLVLLVLTYVDSDNIFFWKKRENMHKIKRIFAVFFVTELLICVPELIFEIKMSHVAESTVTYQAYIVHMLAENSFDRNECAQELETINKFLNLEIIDLYNHECADQSYRDAYWSWKTYQEGRYYAPTSYFTPENQEEFNAAVMKIIKKQPLVFLKSRMAAFRVAAQERNSYNLFLPLLFTAVLFLFALCKKDKVLTTLSLGILGHTAITALTMPASYFKYFFEMYAFGYVFAAVVIIDMLCNHAKKPQ